MAFLFGSNDEMESYGIPNCVSVNNYNPKKTQLIIDIKKATAKSGFLVL